MPQTTDAGGSPRRAGFWMASAACTATVVVALAACVLTMQLWQRDLTVPFAYGRDGLVTLTWVRAMLDGGWWWTSPRLGAPFRMDLFDFPQYPHLHFVIMKILSLAGPEAPTLVNLYFLLGFPLIALAAMAALRSLNLGYISSICGGVLYAFLPYHFWRGVSHLCLGAYYMVPLLFLVVIWVLQDRPFLLVRRDTGRLALALRNPRTIIALLICVAIAFDFTYYPVFGCLFLLLAGVLTACTGGTRLAFFRAVILAAVTAVMFLGNLSPTFLYQLRHGRNSAPLLVTNHPWQDAELYGLTVTQMLLPPAEHRIPAFKAVRDRFYDSTPIVSEGDSMALGAVGSAGLLVLFGAVACCGRSAGPRGRILYLFGLLTVFAVLVCAVGGFSTLFNLLGPGLARTYNRSSVFIGFLAIAAAFLALDALLARLAGGPVRRALGLILPAVVLVLGLLDQTGATYLWDQQAVKAEYDNDADFTARVEASVPKGTMIFQLPYVSFLSYANTSNQMTPNSHFRGFLHSHDLRWSYGATHGRHGDEVHAVVAGRPPEDALRMMAELGFGGVYVDRAGYADGGRELEESLRRLTGAEPIASRNGRLAFYDLGDFARRLRALCTDEEWSARQRQASNPVWLDWGNGFFPEEKDETRTWRWCGPHGEITIHNTANTAQSVALHFKYKAYDPAPAALAVGGPLVSEALRIDSGWTAFDRVVQVPPGRHVIALDCSAAPFVHPLRTLVFALSDATVLPAAAPDLAKASASR